MDARQATEPLLNASLPRGSTREGDSLVAGGMDRASRRRNIFDGGCARFGVPVPFVAHRRVGDTVRRFLVNFPLRVIWPDVAGVAGFGLARLFQAEFVTQVALLALANRTIRRGPTNVVAAFARKARNRRAFERV